jgi:CRISPR-associated protein Cas5t
MTANGKSPGTEPLALRWRLHAPIASFRNPLFAGVQVGLPVVPPSTVRGLLAATVGGWTQLGSPRVGIAFTAAGQGTDGETFHPLLANGRRPPPGKTGGPKPTDREFLVGADLLLWIVADDLDRWAAALRRPVWPLRLGRSQDVVRLSRPQVVRLSRDQDAVQGGALVPSGVAAASGRLYRLPVAVSVDRRLARWGDFVWDGTPDGRVVPTGGGGYADPDGHLVCPIRMDEP